MNERQTDRLIVSVSEKKEGALELLYGKTKNGVYAFLYPFFGNRADTEDCLQDVYIKIAEHARNYKAGTNGRAWILQIAKNTALDCKRKSKRIIYSEEISPPPQENVTQTPVFDAMNAVLSDDERYIVNMHILWGYKHREIADMLNCPVGSVTSKYKRALEKLKKYLKEAE